MNLLSIQSHVAHGHVGNSAAAFPLQRLGVEVWPVHTVQYSNHPGHKKYRGREFGAEHVREVVEGIADLGVLKTCDGVISGYLGSADMGEVVLEAVTKVKAANARALYCCDPVIGDGGKAYVQAGIPEFFRDRVLPAADMLTPNQFELEFLSGIKVRSAAEAASACAALHAKGPATILVTSLRVAGTPRDALDMYASGAGERLRVRLPKLDVAVQGTGDTVAALFFFHFLRTGSLATALEVAAASMYGVLERTQAAKTKEMLLIDAQEEFISPSRTFRAEPIEG
jgi:pyridoxine kinase